MTGCAWLWMYAGLFLMLAELLAPGFVIFFFGLAAMSVGALRFIFGDALSLSFQLAAFSVFSIVYLVFLRRLMKGVFSGRTEVAKTDFDCESLGRLGRVTEAIEPPLAGRVMIGDAEWTALADTAIAVGTNVKVVAQQNLTMKVVAV